MKTYHLLVLCSVQSFESHHEVFVFGKRPHLVNVFVFVAGDEVYLVYDGGLDTTPLVSSSIYKFCGFNGFKL